MAPWLMPNASAACVPLPVEMENVYKAEQAECHGACPRG